MTIRPEESYLYSLLSKYSNSGEWKFFECFDENGNSIPQAKKYSDLDFWVAYPDFEYYNEEKLSLLVELKCYNGYFGQNDYVVAMKKRHFDGYKRVAIREKVEVRACFALTFNNEYSLYWETFGKMNSMKSKTIKERRYKEWNNKTKSYELIAEDYVFWYVTEFRTDYWNLPVI